MFRSEAIAPLQPRLLCSSARIWVRSSSFLRAGATRPKNEAKSRSIQGAARTSYRPDTLYKLHIRFELHTWRSLKTLPSRASRAPQSSSCQSIVRPRGPQSCGRCSMARRSWPADAKSASKKLSPSTTTGLETAVKAMGANGSDPREMRLCGSQSMAPQS